jgi:hypothetical protein
MIQVLARKAIQFRNPNKALVNKQAKLGESNQVMTTKLEEAFVRVIPDKVTLVPDWVKEDDMFKWCVADGTLMEIVVNSSVPGSDLQAKGQQQVADNQSKEEKAASDEAKAELAEKLKGMSKAELIDYAFENHDMELGPAMTKVDILQAIEKAQEDKEKETA